MERDEARVGARVTCVDGTDGAGTITSVYRHLPGCHVEWGDSRDWGNEWVPYADLRLLPDEAQS